ncbi:MAG: response regulator [Acidobacteriota bacterium]
MSEQWQREEHPMVLIAEDDTPLRKLIIAILYRDGYHFVEAENGADAINTLENLVEEPAVALIDLKMPVIDGLTLVKKIRADAKLAQTKIVGISAHAENETTAISAGCDAFLKKPFKPEELTTTIGQLVGRS